MASVMKSLLYWANVDPALTTPGVVHLAYLDAKQALCGRDVTVPAQPAPKHDICPPCYRVIMDIPGASVQWMLRR